MAWKADHAPGQAPGVHLVEHACSCAGGRVDISFARQVGSLCLPFLIGSALLAAFEPSAQRLGPRQNCFLRMRAFPNDYISRVDDSVLS